MLQQTELKAEGEVGAVVTALDVSENGIASLALDNGSLWVFDVEKKTAGLRLEKGASTTWSLARQDGMLLNGKIDGTITLWNLNSRAKTRTFVGHEATVRALLFLDRSRIASGSRDGTVRVWHKDREEPEHILKCHTATVRCLALQDDLLVSGGSDNVIGVWNHRTGEMIRQITGHTDTIWSILIHNSVIWSGGMDGTARRWDLHNGDLQKIVYTSSNKAAITHIKQDQGLIAIAENNGLIHILSGESSEQLYILGDDNSGNTGFDFKNGKILSSGSGRPARLWDLKNSSNPQILDGSYDIVWKSLIYQDNSILAVGKGETSQIEVSLLVFST